MLKPLHVLLNCNIVCHPSLKPAVLQALFGCRAIRRLKSNHSAEQMLKTVISKLQRLSFGKAHVVSVTLLCVHRLPVIVLAKWVLTVDHEEEDDGHCEDVGFIPSLALVSLLVDFRCCATKCASSSLTLLVKE